MSSWRMAPQRRPRTGRMSASAWKSSRPVARPCRRTRCRRSSASCPRSRCRLRESWCGQVRNVLVTGGSRGLGLAIASRLAACGYRVIALARSETKELRAEIDRLAAHSSSRAAGDGEACGELRFRAFDLADIGGIGGLVGELRREMGPLYRLVNNA